MAPTQEQLAVGESIAGGRSVIVDAVAGSGKTTTVLSVAERLPEKLFLQITYNTALKLEVREKVKERSIDNVVVHTYHSLARTYYDPETATDMGIESSLRMPPRDLPAYDIVIIDECQDMTPLLYAFARKVVNDIPRRPLLGLLGDNMQTVYGFKGADPRFLTMGDALWPEFSFARHRLSASFRITDRMAGFVNENLLGYAKITAPKQGPPVDYIVTKKAGASDASDASNALIRIIFGLFQTGIRASDIFVLAPSIAENNRACTRIENALTMHNIPVHIPNQEDRTLDDDVMRNKVVFSTFHQSKGRERKVAIVMGLDGTYSKTFARELRPDECPSTVYVACTRGSQHLVLTQQEDKGCPRFLRISNTGNLRVRGGSLAYADEPMAAAAAAEDSAAAAVEDSGVEYTSRERRACVTKLVRHLSHELVTKLNALVEPLLQRVAPPSEDHTAFVPTKVLTKYRSYEDVSELNAFAVSAMWEVRCGLATPTILDVVRSSRHNKFVQGYVDGLPEEYTKPEHFLYLANVYRAVSTGQLFKLKQITSYRWMRAEDAERILGNYERYVRNIEDFEYTVAVREHRVGDAVTSIVGHIDILTASEVFEIKCTQKLQLEHVIQLVLYKWMWTKNFESSRGPREFRLLNVLTGECVQVNGSAAEIEAVAELLLKEKYVSEAALSDTGFVSRCLSQTKTNKNQQTLTKL